MKMKKMVFVIAALVCFTTSSFAQSSLSYNFTFPTGEKGNIYKNDPWSTPVLTLVDNNRQTYQTIATGGVSGDWDGNFNICYVGGVYGSANSYVGPNHDVKFTLNYYNGYYSVNIYSIY